MKTKVGDIWVWEHHGEIYLRIVWGILRGKVYLESPDMPDIEEQATAWAASCRALHPVLLGNIND